MANARRTPSEWLRLWFVPRERVDRTSYVVSGLFLVAVKYAGDAAIVGVGMHSFWSPLDYLAPPLDSLRELGRSAGRVYLAMVVWMLPFLWIGAGMSVRRAADAARNPWLGLAILVPIVNYLAIVYLSLAPSVPGSRWGVHPRSAGTGRRIAIVVGSALGTSLLGIALILVSAALFERYGAILFVTTPFALGALHAYLLNRRHKFSELETYASLLLVLAFAAAATVLFAVEGAVCILMAAPLAVPIAYCGAVLGRAIALSRPPPQGEALSGAHAVAFVLLAALAGAEPPAKYEFHVTTALDIDVPCQVVWECVIAPAEIAEPPRWYFGFGLAYPLRARLEGQGVGAVRHCEFSTGACAEPITVWDPPHHLAFDVAEQPPVMVELSPYADLHPPHLDGYLRAVRGDFRLVELPGGRTRLERTTWYELRIAPVGYWRLWVDALLHAIHRRVLEHIASSATTRAGK